MLRMIVNGVTYRAKGLWDGQSDLIGDIEIGDRVVVVAGAAVTKSFLDENSVVDGGPAKAISYAGPHFPTESRGADIVKRR